MKGLKGLITILTLFGLAAILLLGNIDLKLYVAYAALLIGLIFLFGFATLGIVTNVKSNFKSVLSILGLVGIVVIAYIITPSGDVSALLYEKTQTGMGWSKIIGSGLYTTYVLMFLMFAMILFFQVRKFFK